MHRRSVWPWRSSVMFAVGWFVRSRTTFVRALFIPSSIIAGFLVLGPQVLGKAQPHQWTLSKRGPGSRASHASLLSPSSLRPLRLLSGCCGGRASSLMRWARTYSTAFPQSRDWRIRCAMASDQNRSGAKIDKQAGDGYLRDRPRRTARQRNRHHVTGKPRLKLNVPAIIIFTVISVLWSVVTLIRLGRRFHRKDWFEHTIADFGESQGKCSNQFRARGHGRSSAAYQHG